ncbi:hypothetical protein RU09_11445 [Microbacterium sp. MEJ108Y]|uniref:hypothetical protein n=1 Tax=Microbacterium sp. MEJ108Y TaxID=1587523 RepID=UPI0005AC2D59|nr:hypothetical protein [Microbacterium sp. MEJ108Y]KIP90352.1 hypothetical protein RU09_11445 [Microbacterium sp. MEJ108Y]
MEASTILPRALIDISRRYDIPVANIRVALRSKDPELREMPESPERDRILPPSEHRSFVEAQHPTGHHDRNLGGGHFTDERQQFED